MTTKLFARLYELDLKIIFNLDPASRAVYLALCYFGSSSINIEENSIKRNCYPSQKKMAELLGCSTGTIRRGISRLKYTSIHGKTLFFKDHNGNIVVNSDHIDHKKMLIVKKNMFKNEYFLNISNSSGIELSDSSGSELSEETHVELSNSSHIDIKEETHVELSNSSGSELSIINTKQKTLNKKGIEIEPFILKRFQSIFSFFNQHSKTQWKGARPIEDFVLIAERSSLNVHQELLHIAAYQLEKIEAFEQGLEQRKFWTGSFWVSGMSQWLNRKHKSTLDYKRSMYMQKIKRLIGEQIEPLKVVEDTPTKNEIMSEDDVAFAKQIILLADTGDKFYLNTLCDFHKSDDFPDHLKSDAIKVLQKNNYYPG